MKSIDYMMKMSTMYRHYKDAYAQAYSFVLPCKCQIRFLWEIYTGAAGQSRNLCSEKQ